MNKWVIVLVAAVFMAVSGNAKAEADCDAGMAHIKASLAEKNYCTTDADCTNVGPICPLGCTIAVNKQEAQKFTEEVASYMEHCVGCLYKCELASSLVCRDKKCVGVYE